MSIKGKIMHSRLIVLALLMSLLGLVSCGGGSDSSQSGSLQNGSVSFAVTNGSSQAFASANIATDTSNTTLYNGPFSCSIGNTCTLSIRAATNSKETYTALFYNADGDLVGAWESRTPPEDGFIRINASATNFGAYLFGQLDKANPDATHISMAAVSNYFSKSDQAALALDKTPDFFLNLKLHSDAYFSAPGAQSTTGYYQQLQTALDSGKILQTPLSYPSTKTIQAQAMVQASGMPANNCSALTTVGGKIIGAIGGWAGGQAVVGGDIVDKIPYLGPVAKTISGLFDAACNNDANRFQAIFDDLKDLKTQLDKLDTKLDNIQSSIDALKNQTAWTTINTSYGNILTTVNKLNTHIVSYQHILNSTTPGKSYGNLVDLFAQTGGLDRDSKTAGTAKNGIQGGALARLNSLAAQKNALDALANEADYTNLKNNLNIVCSNAGLSSADGDIFATRKLCNAIIIKLLVEVAAYQKQASDMIRDELAVISKAESSGITDWPSVPYAGNLDAQQAQVIETSNKALGNVLNGLPNAYNLLDGLSITLITSINEVGLGCNSQIAATNPPFYQPNISAWYPNTVPKEGPYIAVKCFDSSAQTRSVYSKFYYRDSTDVRNVMGVLVDKAATYELARFADPYKTDEGLVYTGARVADILDIASQTKVFVRVNNNPTFCGGAILCEAGNNYASGPDITNYPNYALAPNNADNKNNSLRSIIQDWETGKGKNYYQNAYALMVIEDKEADSTGLKYSYLLGYVYGVRTIVMQGGVQEWHQHQLGCFTLDCAAVGDNKTIQFKDGPTVSMKYTTQNNYTFQVQ
jgi:hypothetical protein